MKKTVYLAIIIALWSCLPLLADGVDMTSKIVNPDFNEKLNGWKLTFHSPDLINGHYWEYHENFDERDRVGYWYFIKGSAFFSQQKADIGASSFTQKIEGLKNGAYVFSVAALMNCHDGVDEDPEDWQNRKGACLIAGESSAPIQGFSGLYFLSYGHCHCKLYNVPAIVTDGTLEVGVRLDEDNNIQHLAIDHARLFFFGDMSADEALQEMKKIQLNAALADADTMAQKPMAREVFEKLEEKCIFGKGVTDPSKYAEAHDSVKFWMSYAYLSISQFVSLTDLIELGREVQVSEWSGNVDEALVELGEVLDQADQDVANHAIAADELSGYLAYVEKAIDRVRIDQLWDKYDELSMFINMENEVSEETPCFGLTEHPGFGEEEGQFPYIQLEMLEKLYDEVGQVLWKIDQNQISPTEGFAYVRKIDAAVMKCIASANRSTISLPFDFLLDPDPNDPSQPYLLRTQEEKDAAVDNPHFFDNRFSEALTGQQATTLRYLTPILQFDREYKAINVSITHTHKDLMAAENDGPYYIVYELYVFDAEGNLVEIPAENISSNVPASSGKITNMIDNDINTFFASPSGGGVPNRGPHTFTIVLPEPMSKLQLVFEDIYQKFAIHSCPNGIRITGLSQSESELNEAITTASQVTSKKEGKDPGYYGKISEAFYSTLVKATEMMNKIEEFKDYEIQAMTDDLVAQTEIELNARKLILPEEGKEYHIANMAGYMGQQGISKVLTVFQDSIVWWDSADLTDKKQCWLFEPVEGDDPEDGYSYFYIKNVALNKYIGEFIPGGEAWEPTGEPIIWTSTALPQYLKMSDVPCKYRLTFLGYGQFNITGYCRVADKWWTMAASGANGGAYSTTPSGNGASAINPNGYGIRGVRGAVTQLNALANSNAAWSIQPVLSSLPVEITVDEDLDMHYIHLDRGAKEFTLTADKACAFEDLKIFGLNRTEFAISSKRQNMNSVSLVFSSYLGDFCISFINKEGVKKLTLKAGADIEKSSMEELSDLYNEYKNAQLLEGEEVGCVKDLNAFTKVMADAEELLENGGDDDLFKNVLNSLKDAVDGLIIIQPEADKKYVIVSADQSCVNSFGTEGALFHNESNLQCGWTLLSADDENFQWEFEPGPEAGVWYIKNVATGTYIYYANSVSVVFSLYDTPTPYELKPRYLNGVNLHCLAEGNTNEWNVNKRDDGLRPYGPIVFRDGGVANSIWFIREVGYYTNVEVIEAEPERPWAKGIYDLYGRRVENPTKGIYIINGKKMLIK